MYFTVTSIWNAKRHFVLNTAHKHPKHRRLNRYTEHQGSNGTGDRNPTGAVLLALFGYNDAHSALHLMLPLRQKRLLSFMIRKARYAPHVLQHPLVICPSYTDVFPEVTSWFVCAVESIQHHYQ